jgi:hypothetical protein
MDTIFVVIIAVFAAIGVFSFTLLCYSCCKKGKTGEQVKKCFILQLFNKKNNHIAYVVYFDRSIICLVMLTSLVTENQGYVNGGADGISGAIDCSPSDGASAGYDGGGDGGGGGGCDGGGGGGCDGGGSGCDGGGGGCDGGGGGGGD